MNTEQLARFQTAKNKIENQDFGAATDILLDLYDEVDENQVVLLLGETLFNDHKFVSASRLVDNHLLIFLQDNFALLTKIYLKNHRYLQLQIIADGQNEKIKHELLSKIKQSEAEYENNEPTTIASKSREFMHLGAFSATRQREVISEAETLPLQKYVAGVRLNLLDQDVNPVWRMQLLNNLMRMGFNKSVDFIWIDDTKHSIIPKSALDIEQTKAFQKMQRVIDETIGQEDPIIAAQLQVVVNVDLQLLFPYIDKIVINPEIWLATIKQKMFGDLSKPIDDKDVLKWLSLIDLIMQTLTN
ncbi:hypothetical protein [Fructilactobacillus frigidiflavus]|uniref:hypothetical protein n=1 Tax=Fructilactobacillus frigidiflavus TaxID=3242688 RepID=UPI00375670F8